MKQENSFCKSTKLWYSMVVSVQSKISVQFQKASKWGSRQKQKQDQGNEIEFIKYSLHSCPTVAHSESQLWYNFCESVQSFVVRRNEKQQLKFTQTLHYLLKSWLQLRERKSKIILKTKYSCKRLQANWCLNKGA